MISLILIFGCLCRSSSWWLRPHIGVCRLLWPLLRAWMGDYGVVFREMYFLYGYHRAPQKMLPNFLHVSPKTSISFKPWLVPEWRSCSVWASTNRSRRLLMGVMGFLLPVPPVTVDWSPNGAKCLSPLKECPNLLARVLLHVLDYFSKTCPLDCGVFLLL